jgi:hypothetical protein
MGKLIYTAIASLDGYIEDETGKFDWAAPMTSCTLLSTTSSDRSPSTYTGAGCTKRWSSGKR